MCLAVNRDHPSPRSCDPGHRVHRGHVSPDIGISSLPGQQVQPGVSAGITVRLEEGLRLGSQQQAEHDADSEDNPVHLPPLQDLVWHSCGRSAGAPCLAPLGRLASGEASSAGSRFRQQEAILIVPLAVPIIASSACTLTCTFRFRPRFWLSVWPRPTGGFRGDLLCQPVRE